MFSGYIEHMLCRNQSRTRGDNDVYDTAKSSMYIFPYTLDMCVLYTNIDMKLRNKLHGPMHYKIGVIWVFNGHEIYALL